VSRGIDRRLTVIVILLTAFGLATIYSTGQTDLVGGGKGAWLRQAHWLWVLQLLWLIVAVVCGAVTYRTSFRMLEWATPWLYGISLALLAATLVIGSGAGTAAGSKSWIAIKGIGGIQPAELAKLATILMLARWFAARREPPTTLRGLLTPMALVGIPALLVLKQPDLGSAIVFGGIFFAMLFWASVPLSLLAMLVSPIVALLLAGSTALWSIWMVVLFILLMIWRPFVLEGLAIYLLNSAMGVLALVVWNKMKPYQKERILSFLDPQADRRGSGWQAIESHVAIGSGGWFGTGFGVGPQKRTGYIPARATDFVFAVVGEELGFIGVIVALGLFLALLFALVRIAKNASDPYASLVVFGVAAVVFTHVFENVGMTISVMPITGIPLPFFSAGGSFLIALAIGLGFAFRAAEEGRSASYLES
jgi:rod shape determining protein RodA